MRVLGISGSLRAGSHNTALLRAAAKAAPAGVEFELYDGLEQLPPYNEDRDTEVPPAEVAELRRRIAQADALVIATPEYNGTVPGQLKHAIDWASRPRGAAALAGKPAVVIGASISDYGAVWAQDHVRRSLGIAGARVLDHELAVGRAHERVEADGELREPETIGALEDLFATLTGVGEQQLAA